MLYAALPQEFTKQMVMEQAEKLNIPVKHRTQLDTAPEGKRRAGYDDGERERSLLEKNKGNKENTRTCIYKVRARV